MLLYEQEVFEKHLLRLYQYVYLLYYFGACSQWVTSISESLRHDSCTAVFDKLLEKWQTAGNPVIKLTELEIELHIFRFEGRHNYKRSNPFTDQSIYYRYFQ